MGESNRDFFFGRNGQLVKTIFVRRRRLVSTDDVDIRNRNVIFIKDNSLNPCRLGKSGETQQEKKQGRDYFFGFQRVGF